MTTTAAERRTMNIEEAARILGISRSSAYQAAKEGRLPCVKVGKRLLIPRAALERLLADGNTGTT